MLKFNPLVDEFPTNYKGYNINTDFRVGIWLTLLFKDSNISDDEKKIEALYLFYGDNIPDDITLAWEGITWFLNLGYIKSINTEKVEQTTDNDTEVEDTVIDNDSEETFDFEFDATRIYTAFMRTYNIDLESTNMHFFKFMFMLSDLSKDTLYNKVVDIRCTSLQGKKGKERETYVRLKKLYAVPTKLSNKDREFLRSIGMSEENIDKYYDTNK